MKRGGRPYNGLREGDMGRGNQRGRERGVRRHHVKNAVSLAGGWAEWAGGWAGWAGGLLLAALGIAATAFPVIPANAQQTSQEIVVAAAANLTEAFQQIANAFRAETGIKVIYNFGATTQLAQQIENGAPFDVFAAADVVHVDQLIQSGKLLGDTRAVYARGRVALWVPQKAGVDVKTIDDLAKASVRFVAIANPQTAPYGAAAVEALKRKGLWERVQGKIVYAENVNAAKQLAATGNAEAAFTAYSLLLSEKGQVITVDESLYTPIDQALGVLASSQHRDAAQRFESFIVRGGGRAILNRFGYAFPGSR
jgi:molybdate transport system substrate-binding protein